MHKRRPQKMRCVCIPSTHRFNETRAIGTKVNNTLPGSQFLAKLFKNSTSWDIVPRIYLKAWRDKGYR